MNIKDQLKRYKPLHWVYNLLNAKKLTHNQQAYKEYDIKKSLFQSISSKDFPDKQSRAWLDIGNSAELTPFHPDFNNFSPDLRDGIRHWSQNGYLIWKSFLNEREVENINKEVDRIIHEKSVSFTHDNKLPFLNKKSELIHDLSHDPELIKLLSFLLGKEVVPFQTLNFIKGSEQKTHSDSIHMTTYPLGFLVAVWIALEDISIGSGPLFYYPGSHRLPYLLNDDFGNISSSWMLGQKNYRDYEDVIEDLVRKKDLRPKYFLPKKGDLLVWHANLLHGGEPIHDPSLSRKSMVIHFYAKDVIKYHEITERPAVL